MLCGSDAICFVELCNVGQELIMGHPGPMVYVWWGDWGWGPWKHGRPALNSQVIDYLILQLARLRVSLHVGLTCVQHGLKQLIFNRLLRLNHIMYSPH